MSGFVPERIIVLFHPKISGAAEEAEQITDYLRERGLQATTCASLYDEDMRRCLGKDSNDALIALGGDGTMLRAGRLALPLDLPILGINLGHFGFLTELERSAWRDMLPLLLEGRFRVEERMTLRVEQRRGPDLLAAWDVINEVVVCRGQVVRPISLKASVDGFLVASLVADGLIVATPTGSTAYALAAGGPILPPELRNILLVAVAPHLSLDRAVILSEGATVTISAHSDHQAVLSIDGQAAVEVSNQDTLSIQSGEHKVRFIRFHDPGYFYRTLNQYLEQNPSAE